MGPPIYLMTGKQRLCSCILFKNKESGVNGTVDNDYTYNVLVLTFQVFEQMNIPGSVVLLCDLRSFPIVPPVTPLGYLAEKHVCT